MERITLHYCDAKSRLVPFSLNTIKNPVHHSLSAEFYGDSGTINFFKEYDEEVKNEFATSHRMIKKINNNYVSSSLKQEIKTQVGLELNEIITCGLTLRHDN